MLHSGVASDLDIIELTLLHRLEMRDLSTHSCEIMLDRFVRRPAKVLHIISVVAIGRIKGIITSGEEILTLRTFSSMIFSSSQADSMNKVYDSNVNREV